MSNSEFNFKYTPGRDSVLYNFEVGRTWVSGDRGGKGFVGSAMTDYSTEMKEAAKKALHITPPKNLR
ncbi:hypothetical protein [Chrysiogenes arsenatis]|uniref:hypothetical protein n=1 Tax=Chrysiogenes arsenatis TaxID=309797 RepID=UPI000409BB95|nr:hypothetical protein [Chrysiogenes arsenatis]